MPDNLGSQLMNCESEWRAGEEFVFIDTRDPQTWAQSE